MGQARNRGTRDQRIAQALERDRAEGVRLAAEIAAAARAERDRVAALTPAEREAEERESALRRASIDRARALCMVAAGLSIGSEMSARRSGKTVGTIGHDGSVLR